MAPADSWAISLNPGASCINSGCVAMASSTASTNSSVWSSIIPLDKSNPTASDKISSKIAKPVVFGFSETRSSMA